jgi:integrase
VYAGKDPLTGKERYGRQTAKTDQAAEIVPTRLQVGVDEDRQPKSDLTVRQAIEQWLEVARLEDTTRDRYDDLCGGGARLLGEAWATDPDWGLLLWLTMVTGSRRGEVSALRWHHVDLAGALLTRSAVTRSRNRA